MSAKKRDFTVALPKQKTRKKKASSKKILVLDKFGEDSTSSSKTRGCRRRVPFQQPAQTLPPKTALGSETSLVNYYLAREGVVLGPYTTFQVLESVRLGIFEDRDLAWSEGSKEWLEISRLLPVNTSFCIQPSNTLPALPQMVKDGEEWLKVSTLLPTIEGNQEQRSSKRLFMPLTPQQLREHETLFGQSPFTVFMAELTRGKFARSFSDFRLQITNGWKDWCGAMFRRCTHPLSRLEEN